MTSKEFTASVAMATFNGERYLLDQLRSISQQSVRPCELVICDDCSSDSTVRIIEKFATTVDFPVHLHRNAVRLGFTQNFSKAASLCKGDIVFLSDQDDVWLPYKVAYVKEAFRQDPNAWIVVHDGAFLSPSGDASSVTKRQQVTAGYGKNAVLQTGCLSSVQRDFLSIALPVPDGVIGHDTWLHQLAALAPNRIVQLADVLQLLRRHENNTSTWVVNSTEPVSKLQVLLSEFHSPIAVNYGDRLALNEGLTQRVVQFPTLGVPQSAVADALRALDREHLALLARSEILALRGFRANWAAIVMFARGQYRYFNGVKSLFRDLSRGKQDCGHR